MSADEDEPAEPSEKYQLYLWMEGGEAAWRYYEQHWFVERPDSGVVALLFEDAKRMFAVLYPDTEPTDFSVGVTRLRPADDFRPDFRPFD
jgi:hypothetical protein